MSWLDGVPMDPLATPAESLPAFPGVPFVQAGVCGLFVGPTGTGRSFLFEICAYDAAKAGISCAYLGHEITEEEFNARAAQIAEVRGDSITDELRGQLAHVRYLDLQETVAVAWEQPEAWVGGITSKYPLLFIDPLSAVETATGKNFEQSNRDYAEFYDRLIQPLISAGVTVLIAENIGHAIEAKGRAKGASAKGDRADLVFSCRSMSGGTGLIVRAGKVRSSRSPVRRGDEWVFHRDSLLIERRAAEAHEAGSEQWRPTHLMASVSAEIVKEPGISKRALRDRVSGRNEYIDQALNLLEADGYIKPKAPYGYTSIRPYFEGDRALVAVPTVPTVPQACPRRAPGDAGGCAHRAYTGHGGTLDPDAELARITEKFGEEAVA